MCSEVAPAAPNYSFLPRLRFSSKKRRNLRSAQKRFYKPIQRALFLRFKSDPQELYLI